MLKSSKRSIMRYLLLFLLFHSLLFGKGYALIIGIDKYDNINGLQGATNDANAMDKLMAKYDIDNRTILLDDKANKKAILSSLEKISKSISRGDKFYMFFSGHGTSLNDSANRDRFAKDKKLLTLLENSGALIPSDYKPNRPLSSLIIGSRDLRPLFEKIDKKGVNSMVVFDACFSGMTYRDVSDKKTKRRYYRPTHTIGFETKPSYPYTSLVYIASTSSSDWAVENIKTNRGYLSQVLEECLDGKADHNQDNKIDKQELKYCIDNSSVPQAPQIYPKESDKNPIVFSTQTKPQTQTPTLNTQNNTISDEYSVLFSSSSTNEREAYKRAYKIIQLKGKGEFSLTAENSQGEKRKMCKVGEDLSLKIESPKEGYLVLVDLDVEGNLYLLEPTPKSHPFIEAKKIYPYTDLAVAKPTGVELLKGFIVSDMNIIKKIKALKTDSNGKLEDVSKLFNILNGALYDTAFLKLSSFED